MKGHMQDGKFHPHTEYKKGTRKSRDKTVKQEGVKIRKQRDTKGQISTKDSYKLGSAVSKLAHIEYENRANDELSSKVHQVKDLVADVVLNNEVDPRLKRDFDPHDPDFCTNCGKMTGTKDLGMTQECKVCGHAKDIGGVLQ